MRTPSAIWAALRAAFHDESTRIYAVTQGTVWFFIVLSVGLFTVELATGLALSDVVWFRLLDTVILLLFVVEIVLRIATYHARSLEFFAYTRAQRLREHVWSRIKYALEPLNVIDLITVLAVLPELRGLRAMRLLRLLRSPRLFKYANPFTGLARAFSDNRFLFYFAFTILGIQVLFGGVSIFLIEDKVETVADGFWWALVTLTTVGFGDITPVTGPGRAVASVLMVGGMFTLAMFAGVVGQTLITSFMSLRKEQYRMTKFLDHVIVCGYNPGARMLLEALKAELHNKNQVVLFAPGERDPDVPPEFAWVDGDPTKESELDKVRPHYAHAVVIVGARAMPPQQADAISIMTVFTFRKYLADHDPEAERQSKIHVVCEILEEENVTHAKTAGADEVIETTDVGFSMIAHSVAEPGTARIIGRVAHVGAHSLFVGHRVDGGGERPFGELAGELKEQQGIMVIGVRSSATGQDRLNPANDALVSPDDEIIYLGVRAVLPDK